MKKLLSLGLVVSMLFASTAYADILPEGKKAVPVCAYFNNTESMLDTMAIYGYETAPDDSMVSISSFVSNECFTKAYKFNTYKVFGLTAEHAVEVAQLDPYDPSTDDEAYPTNIELELGEILVDEDSNVDRIENEYTIVELDLENEMLLVIPVKTTKYFTDETEPEVTEGMVTAVSGASEEEPAEDVFTDVDTTNKYYTALKFLKDEGIIEGYPDGSFKPESTINRAEFTKIIMGAVATQEALTTCAENYTVANDYNVTLFTDVVFAMVGGNEPPWYFDYVCVAKFNAVISGYPDGSFKPEQTINFAEASKIIVNAMGEQTPELTPWYMSYVKELEDKNAIPTSILSFGQYLTRGEMAEIAYRLKAEVTNLPSMTYEGLE
ncbi:S-layer homology domain-containing protein [Candidatus Peregrinibacteria bacterium]|nr:S-layer homology domain-containing protein [Candidatus Peregrinibacteria bacterium]